MAQTLNSYGAYVALADVTQPVDPPAAIGFIVITDGDPNTTQPSVPALGAFAYDNVGNTLYYTSDGTTWVAISGGGGGGSGAVLSGHGAPVSTPTVASVYTDLDSSKFYYWDGSAWQLLIS